MLFLKVTDAATNETVALVHDIKNYGKLTEEHHIRIHELRGGVEGKPIAHYVLNSDQAEELKRHI